VNSKTEPARDAAMDCIPDYFFHKKIVWCGKISKKMFCGFFSFELFFNTHGQKI